MAMGKSVHKCGEQKTVAKPELGTKRDCPECSAKFYDLNKNPAHCPKCGNDFVPEDAGTKRTKAVKTPAPTPAPKKKAAPKNSDAESKEDEVDFDEDMDVDDDLGEDDDTVLDDDEEDEEDVSGIVRGGVRKDDES